MAEKEEIICYTCQKELEPIKTFFSYLGHSFSVDVLKCPQCGEMYIPEAMVKGRMAEVEMLLEDK
jgi:predicted RNA-binding Zn-ribbon protein involved in translation (DUF1610 family)